MNRSPRLPDAYFFLGISMLCLSMIIAFEAVCACFIREIGLNLLIRCGISYQLWDYKQKSGSESIDSSLNNDCATQFVEPVIPIRNTDERKGKISSLEI